MNNDSKNNSDANSLVSSTSSSAPTDFNVHPINEPLSGDDSCDNNENESSPLRPTPPPSPSTESSSSHVQISSTTSSAPTFQLTAVLSESALQNITEALSKNCDADNLKSPTCPVCNLHKKTFFCSSCIKNGDFTYSKGRFPERFAEKKLKYFELKEEMLNLNETIESIFENKIIIEELLHQEQKQMFNVEYLKKLIQKSHDQLSNSKSNLLKNQQNQSECCQRSSKLKEKVNSIGEYLNRKQQSIEKRNEEKSKVVKDVQHLLRQRITELTTLIFPIEVNPNTDEVVDSEATSLMETTPLLKFNETSNANNNYSVVEPWIPGNGDYSAYFLSSLPRREYSGRDSSYRNSEFRIGAALAYTTQLLNIIANILDVRLPLRVSYSEFCQNLDENNFLYRVAKLNANIIYLCLFQNVNSELLHPKSTIRNLLYLLNQDSEWLGSSGPIRISTDFLENVEEALQSHLKLIEEPEIDMLIQMEQDNEDLTDYAWIDNSNLPELQLDISSQTTSLAGGFVSSVASLWKTATGQK